MNVNYAHSSMLNPNTSSPAAAASAKPSTQGETSPEKMEWPQNLFAWPKPPFHIYAEEPAWAQAQACEIEGLKGAIRHCFLCGIAEQEKALMIQIVLTKAPFPLAFSQFRKLTLKQALKPNDGPDGEAFSDVIGERYYTDYQLQLKNGETLSGRTVGYVETAFGLFLFLPLDEVGTVESVFVPNEAYASSRFEALRPQDFDAQVLNTEVKPITLPVGTLKEPQIVTPEQLLLALEKQSTMPIIRLGEALVRLGYITDTQLHQALAFRKADDPIPLGQLLVNLGFLTRKKLNTALARKMGYPMVNVGQFPIDTEALRKVSMAVAQRLMVLPLLLHPNLLVVAAADPTLHGMIEELEFLAQVRVVAVLGDSLQIMSVSSSAYQKIGGNAWADNSNLIDFSDDLTNPGLDRDLLEPMELPERPSPSQDRQHDADQPQIEPSDSALVQLVQTMMIEAQARAATDIHVECQARRAKVRIRFRRAGSLSPYLELPYTYRAALMARLKLMAELDAAERRRPQDGKIDFHKFSPKHRLELRMATIPTANGLEDVVLHLLPAATPIALDNLGLSASNLGHLRDAISRPRGLVLCVGPTGSGKTTLLHSLLHSLSTPERKIWTVEDPIEITQTDLRQVQINPSIDWTFAKALRSILRADPDIIMVGEISDQETARIAIDASLSAHLLLSALPVKSAAETVTRLLDMGVNPFSLADALSVVLAQRLVRRLCERCKVQVPAPDALIDELLNDYLQAFPADRRPERAALLAQWRTAYGQDKSLQSCHAPGCEECQGSGFAGRVGLHELLCMTPGLQSLIQKSARADLLLAEAFRSGDFHTLRQDGIVKVLQGLTTLEEVRAIGDV